MYNMKCNREKLQDKIHGCWIGKNIGGTIGDPYEGRKELLDVKGFITEKGEPLPNDDLDLQLVWLRALEEVGPKGLTANVLAEYWLTFITPNWNEYGIGKSNLEMGLLPPLSGEYKNVWKNSNGAWIRSEIWACLTPGLPKLAIKYALMDAQIDHGMGEGTYAEMFTAALESMAFFESDLRALIEKALTFIPETCRVARSVRVVLKAYDEKLEPEKARERVLEDNADLGWFQAPGNIAFVVLGLLYGEGDFKKSILYAVNCGDDTDCTGATVGGILGIVLGASGIPEDWKEYIGDSIKTLCINGSYSKEMPKSCAELTEKIMFSMEDVLRAYQIHFEYTDGENDIEEVKNAHLFDDVMTAFFVENPYGFVVPSPCHSETIVLFEKEPVVKPGDDFKVKVITRNKRRNPMHAEYDVGLPAGWSATYSRSAYLYHYTAMREGICEWEMTVHVGETVMPQNRIQIMITLRNRATPIMVPIVLLG